MGTSAWDAPAVDGDALAVALHRNLLDVRRELRERLRVREDRARGAPEEGDVPHGQHAEGDGEVLLEGRGGEVLVDVPRALEEFFHRVEAVLKRQREHADGGAHGVSTADPVPEPERVVRVYAELGHELEVRGDGDHVLLHGFLPERRGDPRPHGARVEHRLYG